MATLRFVFSFLILGAAYYGLYEFVSDRWPLNNGVFIIEAALFTLMLIAATWLLVDYTIRCYLRHQRKQKLERDAEAQSARDWEQAQAEAAARTSGDRHQAVPAVRGHGQIAGGTIYPVPGPILNPIGPSNTQEI